MIPPSNQDAPLVSNMAMIKRINELEAERDQLRAELAAQKTVSTAFSESRRELRGKLNYAEIGRQAAVDDKDGWRQRCLAIENERDQLHGALSAIREQILHETGPLEINDILTIIDGNAPNENPHQENP